MFNLSEKKPFSIANAVNPSKSRITLAESEYFKPPSYVEIHSLELQIHSFNLKSLKISDVMKKSSEITKTSASSALRQKDSFPPVTALSEPNTKKL